MVSARRISGAQRWRIAVGGVVPERERRWQSGQTMRDYCRAEGLKESAFYFWK
jgi:hypothetical protein